MTFASITPPTLTANNTFNIHKGIEELLETANLPLSLEAIRLSKDTPTIIAKIPLDLNQRVTKDTIVQFLSKVTDETAKDALVTMILKQIDAFKSYLQEIASPATSFTYKLGVMKDASNPTPNNLRIDEDKIAGSFPISIAQLHGVCLENHLDGGRLASFGEGYHFIHSAIVPPVCTLINASSIENATFLGVIQASHPATTISSETF